jgi:hypothetical protein
MAAAELELKSPSIPLFKKGETCYTLFLISEDPIALPLFGKLWKRGEGEIFKPK